MINLMFSICHKTSNFPSCWLWFSYFPTSVPLFFHLSSWYSPNCFQHHLLNNHQIQNLNSLNPASHLISSWYYKWCIIVKCCALLYLKGSMQNIRVYAQTHLIEYMQISLNLRKTKSNCYHSTNNYCMVIHSQPESIIFPLSSLCYWFKHLYEPHIFSYNCFDERLPRTYVNVRSIFFGPFAL